MGAPYYYIDTAPFMARFELLSASMPGLVAVGQLKGLMQVSQMVRRLVQSYARCEGHNHLLTRKLNMLTHPSWRRRVLKELGGLRKLSLWQAAQERVRLWREAKDKAPCDIADPGPKLNSTSEPAWLYTQRLAESEVLKARARLCLKAGIHPNIERDKFKVDFEGEFRLPPIPRGERANRQVKVYTAQTISDYDYNPIPFAKEVPFGVAIVWPEEFYAAALAEEKIASEPSAETPEPIKIDPEWKPNSRRNQPWDILPTRLPQEIMPKAQYMGIFGSILVGTLPPA